MTVLCSTARNPSLRHARKDTVHNTVLFISRRVNKTVQFRILDTDIVVQFRTIIVNIAVVFVSYVNTEHVCKTTVHITLLYIVHPKSICTLYK